MSSKELVSYTSTTSHTLPHSTTSHQISPTTTTIKTYSTAAPNPSIYTLGTYRGSLLTKGFSSTAAKCMAKAQKSSGEVYDAKWRIFSGWCNSLTTDPCDPSVQLVTDFLCHLRDEKHLAVSTIGGYRTAISHVLRTVRDLNVAKDQALSSLLTNFVRDTNTTRSLQPSWDLVLVLQVLPLPPVSPWPLLL